MRYNFFCAHLGRLYSTGSDPGFLNYFDMTLCTISVDTDDRLMIVVS